MTLTTLPVLYHRGSKGELREWRVWADGPDIITSYGVYLGAQQTSRKRAEAKNVGRSNATSAEAQAVAEAQSMWQYKLDRKYSQTPAEAQEPSIMPMLAKAFDPKKLPSFPVYIQPKLDGVRALAYWRGDELQLMSRSNKPWTVPVHILEHLRKGLPKDSMLDGELYVHGESCQHITSLVKKYRKGETETVQYWVYDAPVVQGDDALPFEHRIQHAEEILSSVCTDDLCFVDTRLVSNTEALAQEEQRNLGMGYEGSIVRSPSGLYKFGYRSGDLLKLKRFQDTEFVVVGAQEGVGKMKGHVIFKCQNDLNDQSFDVIPAASMEDRALMWKNRKKFIGRPYTVKFFDRTDDGLPRFPVGKFFRDEKDIG